VDEPWLDVAVPEPRGLDDRLAQLLLAHREQSHLAAALDRLAERRLVQHAVVEVCAQHDDGLDTRARAGDELADERRPTVGIPLCEQPLELVVDEESLPGLGAYRLAESVDPRR